MIVTSVESTSRTLGGQDDEVRWRCLARRGMMHSECESVDHVRLPAHAEFDPRGREGVETAWFVLDGRGWLRADTVEKPLRAGDLVLAAAGRSIRFTTDNSELELLWLAVLPSAVSAVLPTRKPVA